ncbi:MAG: zinc-binding alcohol dehydrogenase family protein [Planctomycetota bacterium]
MKAIRLDAPREFSAIEVESPQHPGPGEVLVRTHRMGICGTDTSGYLGKFPFFQYPRIPGHELGVEVVEVGEGVTHVSPGDACSVEPYMNCKSCHACRKNQGNCCVALNVIGVMVDGGLQEQFLVRGDKLHSSNRLTFDQLALVETLAIGKHASDRGGGGAGDHVLVIGAGPIGLATLEFVRISGATPSVMDLSQPRLDFVADTYGVDHLIRVPGVDEASTATSVIDQVNDITEGNRYDVVIDATGNHHSMSAALEYVAPTGCLAYVGITTQAISFQHVALHRPEVTLKASRNALPGDFTQIIQWMEEGRINTQPWITHRTSFDRVIDDFESFTRPETGVIKAVIEVC